MYNNISRYDTFIDSSFDQFGLKYKIKANVQ